VDRHRLRKKPGSIAPKPTQYREARPPTTRTGPPVYFSPTHGPRGFLSPLEPLTRDMRPRRPPRRSKNIIGQLRWTAWAWPRDASLTTEFLTTPCRRARFYLPSKLPPHGGAYISTRSLQAATRLINIGHAMGGIKLAPSPRPAGERGPHTTSHPPHPFAPHLPPTRHESTFVAGPSLSLSTRARQPDARELTLHAVQTARRNRLFATNRKYTNEASC